MRWQQDDEEKIFLMAKPIKFDENVALAASVTYAHQYKLSCL